MSHRFELPLLGSNQDSPDPEEGLSHRAAAHRLGVAQPDLSNLCRGRLDGFSIERLCRLLTALGQDVRIVVQPKPRSRSRATLRATVAAD